MTNTIYFRFAWIGAFALLSAGCGSSAQKPSSTPKTVTASTDGALVEALGSFQLQRDGARALTLLAAAAEQSPNRTDVAMMQMSLCLRIEGCQPGPYEVRLNKLDRGNATAWLGSLARAQRQRDTAVEAQVLDVIGRSERFDLYWNQLVSSIARARAQSPAGVDAALNETIAWLGQTIVPSFAPLTLACSRNRTAEPQWAERCRRVANVLINGDTYIAESVGIRIAQQVTAEAGEVSRLNERARASRYLWRASGDIISAQVQRDKFSAEVLQLMSKLRREQDVQVAIVRWAKLAVTPPLDFSMDE